MGDLDGLGFPHPLSLGWFSKAALSKVLILASRETAPPVCCCDVSKRSKQPGGEGPLAVTWSWPWLGTTVPGLRGSQLGLIFNLGAVRNSTTL